MNAGTPTESRSGYWWRVLRPLVWWLLLVMVLLAVHQHQLALERTRIYFSASMNETNAVYDALVTLDGRQIGSGDKISLGSHHLTVTQPKAETFNTNFFAWYGRHDAGKINLNRATGTLKVMAEPAASVVTITGPAFALTLNESPGTNLTVPTDAYHVAAQYAHWSGTRDVLITAGNMASCNFSPHLGALSLSCNETGATYQVRDGNGNQIEDGRLPATVVGLPSGEYQVTVAYHNHQLVQTSLVAADTTNDVPFRFIFGAITFECVPPGATVYDRSGNRLGVTPLRLLELPPGPAEFNLQLNGYEDATVSADVTADQTNAVSTNLVSLQYLSAVRDARQYLAAGSYAGAVQAVGQALNAKPNDAIALALQAEASGHLNTERQQADAERRRVERLTRPRGAFDALCAQNPDAALFEEHQMTSRNPAKNVEIAIVQALQAAPMGFEIQSDASPQPDTYEVTAQQTFSLGILGGTERICLLVVGQTNDDETQILFKVVEYQIQHTIVNFQDEKQLIPVHPSRMQMNDLLQTRVRDGVRDVTERIQKASR